MGWDTTTKAAQVSELTLSRLYLVCAQHKCWCLTVVLTLAVWEVIDPSVEYANNNYGQSAVIDFSNEFKKHCPEHGLLLDLCYHFFPASNLFSFYFQALYTLQPLSQPTETRIFLWLKEIETKFHFFRTHTHNVQIYTNTSYCESTVLMWAIKSHTRLEYPHSLSYHDTSLTKLELREIPALASKTEEWASPMKSVETTSSSVYPKIPFHCSDSEALRYCLGCKLAIGCNKYSDKRTRVPKMRRIYAKKEKGFETKTTMMKQNHDTPHLLIACLISS